MDLQKKKLAIVQWGTYRSYPVGGISSYIEAVIPQLSEMFDLKLIGMSAPSAGEKLSEKLGQWTTIDVEGKTYDFLPVVSSYSSDILPDRLRLAYAMFRYRSAVRESQADAYYIHMTEAALGLMAQKRPIIVHVHGLYNLFRYSRFGIGGLYTDVYERYYPHLFSRCAQVIGVGSKKEFGEFRKTMHVKSGVVMPTCVREQVFYPRDRAEARRALGLVANEIVLLYVGRLTEPKNPRLLIEAGQLLRAGIPDLKLVFVGYGPLQAAIEEEAARSPNIVVTGTLSPEKTALWMNAADALTVVSKTEAFMSIVALEALSCGVPVVATPVSALPLMIKAGVNGAVSRDLTPKSYAQAVQTVLRNPPSAQSCAESVAAYTSAAVAARVSSEIQRVLSNDIILSAAAD